MEAMPELWHVITLQCTDHRACFAQNTHNIVLQRETPNEFIGWPDPRDGRNSDAWKPGQDRPLTYPKFAWEKAT